MKLLHLRNDILDKTWKIKHGIIWGYCASHAKPFFISEIAKHFNISNNAVRKSMTKLIEIGAMEELTIDEKMAFQAKIETYFTSDDGRPEK